MALVSSSAESSAGEIQSAVVAAYRAKTLGSHSLFTRAARALVGGTSGNLRHFHPYPLYFSHGRGSEMCDVDGNDYVDCFLCNGPLLLGHRHPGVLAAIREHDHVGSLVVNPALGIALAEKIQQVIPAAQRVRFLNSGTEAVLTAVRLARAFTRKPRIVKFFGHYHGQDDQFLIGLDPTGGKFGSGIPDEAVANTALVKYGDINALEEALDRDSEIGTVMLDPAMHAGGLWGSSTSYLRDLRTLTAGRKIVLIFDEVITGFRVALGGAQAVHGITPDLATFGKALAAGEKLAAVVGREDIMRGMDPERPPETPAVFQSGTGNDGTAALAAAGAAIDQYRELSAGHHYASLANLARRLAIGIADAFKARSIPCHVNQIGPMLQLFLSDAAPAFETFSRIPPGPLALFYLALINENILLSLPTSNHVYLSFAHTDGDMERILKAVSKVLDTYDFAAVVRAGSFM
jgi:glutamate-1-semialdehyde 2,1-aminomutase